MNGLIPQFYSGFYKGIVNINGKNTSTTPISDLSTEVGIVFQNPENQLVSMNVEHEIAFGLENLGVPPEDISRKIKKSASLTEIEHLMDKAPFELSGGEQQRVALASILVLEPKILILDEPTALLDPYMAKKIVNLLKEIQAERRITILISEHRLDLLLPLAEQMILMEEARVIEHGSTEEVLNGKNFARLRLNKPTIFRTFNSLQQSNLYLGKIPTSIPGVIKTIKNYRTNR
jgi:energy-coupling factor transporter ATP-binding protein EcfA2